MPEFQFDPSIGEAISIDPRASKHRDNVESEVSPEEIEQSRHDRMARGLSDRATRQHKSSAGDSHTYIQAEAQLLDLQSQFSRETNPIQQRVLEEKINALASALVEKDPGLTESALDDPDRETLEEYLLGNDPTIQEDLAWAGENLPERFNQDFNKIVVDSNDEALQSTGYQFIKEMRNNPSHFTPRDQTEALTDVQITSMESMLGPETTHDIVVMSEMIRANKINTIDAMKLCAKSPRLMKGLRTAAEAGLINIAI